MLGAKRWDVLVKIGLPRSMPYFFGSLKVAITLAFVGTTVSEMTAANEGIGYLLISAGSSMQMGLAFAGLMVVGAMAMLMYELFSVVEKHTTGWRTAGRRTSERHAGRAALAACAPASQQAAVKRTSSPCTKGSKAARTVSMTRSRVAASACSSARPTGPRRLR